MRNSRKLQERTLCLAKWKHKFKRSIQEQEVRTRLYLKVISFKVGKRQLFHKTKIKVIGFSYSSQETNYKSKVNKVKVKDPAVNHTTRMAFQDA